MEDLTTVNPTTPVGNPSNIKTSFKSLMVRSQVTKSDGILPRTAADHDSPGQTVSSSDIRSPTGNADKSFTTPDNIQRCGSMNMNSAQQSRLVSCSVNVPPSVTPSSVVSNRSSAIKEDDVVSVSQKPTALHDKDQKNDKGGACGDAGVTRSGCSSQKDSLDSRVMTANLSTASPLSKCATTKSTRGVLSQKLSQESQHELYGEEHDQNSRPTIPTSGKLMPPKGHNRSTTPVPLGVGNKMKTVRTPVRSPITHHRNNSWNAFHDHNSSSGMPNFGSPSVFLSPYLPSPPDTLDKKSGSHAGGNDKGKKDVGGITPTNFATDFAKSDFHDDSLNNVLPWLSPNAYALFSPGGFTTNSAFSASGGKRNQATSVENGSKPQLPFDGIDSQGGMMICVSPLARKSNSLSNSRNSSKQPETPINFHEVFASPKSDLQGKFQTAVLHHDIPTISDSSNRDSKFVLEKHLTEREVKEDEDLNVLLKLAETTPRSNADGDDDNEGTRVFRGAGGAFSFPASQPAGPPSFLHLPLIGKNSKLVKSASLPKDNGKVGSGKGASSSPKKRKIPGNPGSQSNKSISLSLGNRSAPAYYPTSFLHPSTGAGASTAAAAIFSCNAQNGQLCSAPFMYSSTSVPAGAATVKGLKKKSNDKTCSSGNLSTHKRPLTTALNSTNKKSKKELKGRGPSKKKINTTSLPSPVDKEKAAETISAINSASGKKNDKAASLASAILRGVTMRPSGKWQAQLYFAGKSRYIGVFNSREKAALAYEIAREHLQDKSATSSKDTEVHVNAARKAAFEGVNEKDPRLAH